MSSASYKALLASASAADEVRQKSIENLKRLEIREQAKRLAAEREQVAKARRQRDEHAARLKQEREQEVADEHKKAALEQAKKTKAPLSAEEAKVRRHEAERQRMTRGRQDGPVTAAPSLVATPSYKDLLSKAPTQLQSDRIVRAISSSSSPSKANKATSLPKSTTVDVLRRKVPNAASSSPASKTSSAIGSRSGTPLAIKPTKSTTTINAQSKSTVIARPPPSSFLNTAKPIGRGAPPLETNSKSNTKMGTKARGKKIINVAELQPLQKNGKRDMRTIEEIQNDIWRKKGKDYAHLRQPQSSPIRKALPNQTQVRQVSSKTAAQNGQVTFKRKQNVDEDSDEYDSFVESEDDDLPSRSSTLDVSAEIWKMFGKRKQE